MPQYRIYRLTPAGKIAGPGGSFDADDDNHAKHLAHDYCNAETPTVELWVGARLVGRLPCETTADAA